MAAIGLSWPWGGMGEYAVVNDYNVTKIPTSLSDIQGALVEPGAVALYMVERGGVGAGSTVLVSGGGPIGAMTVLASRAAGASRVSEPNEVRLRMAAELAPVVIAIDPNASDILTIIRDMTEEGVVSM
jgi:(R,R)-butanediol dehydrogenase/meso-butanediol dehydrogenase/diacetyl reductase